MLIAYSQTIGRSVSIGKMRLSSDVRCAMAWIWFVTTSNGRGGGSVDRALLLPCLPALFDLVVSAVDPILPRLGDDAGVVIIRSMVDEKRQVVVAGLVSIVVEELEAG